MTRFRLSGALGAAVLLASLSSALAHASLAVTEAAPRSTYRGVVWVEIPGEGQDPHSLKRPAPAVRILAAAAKADSASTFHAGSIVVEAPWSRATPGGARVAVGYMRITNTGNKPDRLLRGSAEIAGRFEVHSMSMDAGVARMAPVEGGLVIKPGETVELKPGGYHAMMMDLKGSPKEGDVLRGTLTFEKAGTVPIEYRVGGIGAQGVPEEHRHH